MRKICPICQTIFTASGSHKKYCSDACANEARLKRDRESHARAADRKAEAIIAERQRKRAEQAEAERIRREEAEAAALADTQDRAARGDPEAIMELSGMDQAEYWRAYKLAKLEEYAGELPDLTVNGVSISEPDFPELVIMSFAVTDRVFIRRKC